MYSKNFVVICNLLNILFFYAMIFLKIFLIFFNIFIFSIVFIIDRIGGKPVSRSIYTQEKFCEIYNKYADMVYRICFMMLKEQSSAEDATQNVFIKFIKASKEYESENHLKASLIVIAKNECKNHLKHWWNSKRDSFDDITEPSYNDNHKFSDVKDAINRLPDKYKIPVYLFYYEGYTTEEISKMLKINHSTIRSHLLEARKRLKIILEENNNE